MKTRLELDCVCRLCHLCFNVWNLEELIKEVGDGIFISGYRCPNCESRDLSFDIHRQEVPK